MVGTLSGANISACVASRAEGIEPPSRDETEKMPAISLVMFQNCALALLFINRFRDTGSEIPDSYQLLIGLDNVLDIKPVQVSPSLATDAKTEVVPRGCTRPHMQGLYPSASLLTK
jgi:hypothetical protein